VLQHAAVRDRAAGLARPARPADVAILFRSRDSHREFEKALARLDIATYVYKGLGFFDADEVQDVVALLKYLADPWSDLRGAALLRSRFVRLSDAAIASLAPHVAAAIVGQEAADAVSRFSEEDRRVLGCLREALPRWLSLVDRSTASGLLSAVLKETGYLYEIRGRGSRQAGENLKKLRGIVRRFENRGYATLRRVAEHLDELAVGDESNASIDATDAVSLMTVHAAKGLEFPIVFVVNMNRGIGGIRPPIRVAAGAPADEAVAIADYQSEADEDQKGREREETKRLLYVALTRARDRLYLSAIVKEGVCRMGRGSLGEVLPEDLKRLFADAAAESGPRRATWQGAQALHELAVR
jgi:ATP-dependent helicase/nuclease subunit A